MHKFQSSNSQIGQESFVLNVLSKKQNGVYVEIGAGSPSYNNNTLLLEKEYGWSGVGFEIRAVLAKKYNETRSNPCIQTDARTFNYLHYFQENNFPNQIDYLQMDIHPHSDTLIALKQLPLSQYRFSVITYEHGGDKELQFQSREIFNNLGYFLVIKDVRYYDTYQLEDWWVDPTAIDLECYVKFINADIDHRKIFSINYNDL